MVMNYSLYDTQVHMLNHYKRINSAKSVVNSRSRNSRRKGTSIKTNKSVSTSSVSSRFSTPTPASSQRRLRFEEIGNPETCIQSTVSVRKEQFQETSTEQNNDKKENCSAPASRISVSNNRSQSVPEYEYLQFSLRITEDIIRNDLYSNKEMQRVFNSHIEANRGRLDMKKMTERIDDLCAELNLVKRTSERASMHCKCKSKDPLKSPKEAVKNKIMNGQDIITDAEIKSLNEKELQEVICELLETHEGSKAKGSIICPNIRNDNGQELINGEEIKHRDNEQPLCLICEPCLEQDHKTEKHEDVKENLICDCENCKCELCVGNKVAKVKKCQCADVCECKLCIGMDKKIGDSSADCDCIKCVCETCSTKKTKACDCAECFCEPCADKSVKKPVETKKCDCQDCLCEKCGDKTHEGNKANKNDENDCHCIKCSCVPCIGKEPKPVKEEPKALKCDCVNCTCELCNGKELPIKEDESKEPRETCNCDVCTCEPCHLKEHDAKESESKHGKSKGGKRCDCPKCVCGPCPDKEKGKKKGDKKCDCPKCFCDPCLDKEHGKSKGNKPCDCLKCVCDPCLDKEHGKSKQCDCPKCMCAPCLDKEKDKSTSHVPCNCAKCNCNPCLDPNMHTKGDNSQEKCNCVKCVCKSQLDKEHQSKEDNLCDCVKCVCESCLDKSRQSKQNDLKIEGTKTICDCPTCKCVPCKNEKHTTDSDLEPCNCEDCKCLKSPNKIKSTLCICKNLNCPDKQQDKPTICECPTCNCKPICKLQGKTTKEQKKCDCIKCLCEPCLDKDHQKEGHKCSCLKCLCNLCIGMNDRPGDGLKGTKSPTKCDCEKCMCNPCQDTDRHGDENKIKSCDCEICTCDPCNDKNISKKPNTKLCSCTRPSCPDKQNTDKKIDDKSCDCSLCECESCDDGSKDMKDKDGYERKEKSMHSKTSKETRSYQEQSPNEQEDNVNIVGKCCNTTVVMKKSNVNSSLITLSPQTQSDSRSVNPYKKYQPFPKMGIDASVQTCSSTMSAVQSAHRDHQLSCEFVDKKIGVDYILDEIVAESTTKKEGSKSKPNYQSRNQRDQIHKPVKDVPVCRGCCEETLVENTRSVLGINNNETEQAERSSKRDSLRTVDHHVIFDTADNEDESGTGSKLKKISKSFEHLPECMRRFSNKNLQEKVMNIHDDIPTNQQIENTNLQEHKSSRIITENSLAKSPYEAIIYPEKKMLTDNHDSTVNSNETSVPQEKNINNENNPSDTKTVSEYKSTIKNTTQQTRTEYMDDRQQRSNDNKLSNIVKGALKNQENDVKDHLKNEVFEENHLDTNSNLQTFGTNEYNILQDKPLDKKLPSETDILLKTSSFTGSSVSEKVKPDKKYTTQEYDKKIQLVDEVQTEVALKKTSKEQNDMVKNAPVSTGIEEKNSTEKQNLNEPNKIIKDKLKTNISRTSIKSVDKDLRSDERKSVTESTASEKVMVEKTLENVLSKIENRDTNADDIISEIKVKDINKKKDAPITSSPIKPSFNRREENFVDGIVLLEVDDKPSVDDIIKEIKTKDINVKQEAPITSPPSEPSFNIREENIVDEIKLLEIADIHNKSSADDIINEIKAKDINIKQNAPITSPLLEPSVNKREENIADEITLLEIADIRDKPVTKRIPPKKSDNPIEKVTVVDMTEKIDANKNIVDNKVVMQKKKIKREVIDKIIKEVVEPKKMDLKVSEDKTSNDKDADIAGRKLSENKVVKKHKSVKPENLNAKVPQEQTPNAINGTILPKKNIRDNEINISPGTKINEGIGNKVKEKNQIETQPALASAKKAEPFTIKKSKKIDPQDKVVGTDQINLSERNMADRKEKRLSEKKEHMKIETLKIGESEKGNLAEPKVLSGKSGKFTTSTTKIKGDVAQEKNMDNYETDMLLNREINKESINEKSDEKYYKFEETKILTQKKLETFSTIQKSCIENSAIGAIIPTHPDKMKIQNIQRDETELETVITKSTNAITQSDETDSNISDLTFTVNKSENTVDDDTYYSDSGEYELISMGSEHRIDNVCYLPTSNIKSCIKKNLKNNSSKTESRKRVTIQDLNNFFYLNCNKPPLNIGCCKTKKIMKDRYKCYAMLEESEDEDSVIESIRYKCFCRKKKLDCSICKPSFIPLPQTPTDECTRNITQSTCCFSADSKCSNRKSCSENSLTSEFAKSSSTCAMKYNSNSTSENVLSWKKSSSVTADTISDNVSTKSPKSSDRSDNIVCFCPSLDSLVFEPPPSKKCKCRNCIHGHCSTNESTNVCHNEKCFLNNTDTPRGKKMSSKDVGVYVNEADEENASYYTYFIPFNEKLSSADLHCIEPCHDAVLEDQAEFLHEMYSSPVNPPSGIPPDPRFSFDGTDLATENKDVILLNLESQYDANKPHNRYDNTFEDITGIQLDPNKHYSPVSSSLYQSDTELKIFDKVSSCKSFYYLPIDSFLRPRYEVWFIPPTNFCYTVATQTSRDKMLDFGDGIRRTNREFETDTDSDT